MTDHRLPPDGRIAAIDFGRVRLGLAISDARQTLASPFANYERRGLESDAEYLTRFTRDEQVVGFVVGLPVHLSGQESRKSNEARQFGNWLARVTDLPVCWFDERFSSAAAETVLACGGLTAKQKKQRRDMLAAQVILAAYLESSRDGSESTQPLDDSQHGSC